MTERILVELFNSVSSKTRDVDLSACTQGCTHCPFARREQNDFTQDRYFSNKVLEALARVNSYCSQRSGVEFNLLLPEVSVVQELPLSVPLRSVQVMLPLPSDVASVKQWALQKVQACTEALSQTPNDNIHFSFHFAPSIDREGRFVRSELLAGGIRELMKLVHAGLVSKSDGVASFGLDLNDVDDLAYRALGQLSPQDDWRVFFKQVALNVFQRGGLFYDRDCRDYEAFSSRGGAMAKYFWEGHLVVNESSQIVQVAARVMQRSGVKKVHVGLPGQGQLYGLSFSSEFVWVQHNSRVHDPSTHLSYDDFYLLLDAALSRGTSLQEEIYEAVKRKRA